MRRMLRSDSKESEGGRGVGDFERVEELTHGHTTGEQPE